MPEFTPSAEDVKTFQGWQPTGPANVPGMVEPGNIDLTKRPLVHHSDGSVSTLYSASISTPKGEVLIPLVSQEGKMLTVQQGIALYKKTGRHLGIFKTPEAADAHANLLHLKQGAFQTWKNGGKYNPSAETYDNWKESQ